MATAFTSTVLINFTAIVLKSIIHTGMTEFIPADLPGSDFAKTAGEGIIDCLSNSLSNKVRKFLSQEPTMQEKLNTIVQIAFDEINEKHECRFTGIPADLMKSNPDVRKKEDFWRYVWKWIKKKNEETVPQVNQETVTQFVNDFYQKVTDHIDRDDALKAHLATLRTEEGVRTLLTEIADLKKAPKAAAVPAQFDDDDLQMAEEKLNEQLAALQAAKSGSIIITEGSDNIVANNEQTGDGNLIQTHGDHNFVFGNKQSN